MANLTAPTATAVNPVEIIEQFTGPAAEDLVAGRYVRYNTTSGKIEYGKATTSAESRSGGIAMTSAAEGITLTALRKGIIDLGDILGDLGYDADVFLSDTDGRLADAAGSVSKVVGTVVPIWGHTTADKGLRVDL